MKYTDIQRVKKGFNHKFYGIAVNDNHNKLTQDYHRSEEARRCAAFRGIYMSAKCMGNNVKIQIP